LQDDFEFVEEVARRKKPVLKPQDSFPPQPKKFGHKKKRHDFESEEVAQEVEMAIDFTGFDGKGSVQVEGLADDLFLAENEDEICQKCHKARPEDFPLGQDVEWVGCDKCSKWYHVLCVGFSNAA